MTDAELAVVVRLKDQFSKQLDNIVKNTEDSARKMESSWSRLTTGITAAKVAITGWLTGKTAQAIGSIVDLAVKADRANVAFGAMARRIGVDTTQALEAMRRASGDTVADLDLMAAANRAIMLGAARSVPELERLTRYGARLGSVLGLTAEEGIERFTTGLARQSTAILDSVGVVVRLEDEYERLGRKQSDMTRDEQQAIFHTVAWRAAGETMATLGNETAKTAEAADRMAASFKNLKVAAVDLAAEPAAGIMDWLAATMKRMKETDINERAGGFGPSALAVRRMEQEHQAAQEARKAAQEAIKAAAEAAAKAEQAKYEPWLPSDAYKAGGLTEEQVAEAREWFKADAEIEKQMFAAERYREAIELYRKATRGVGPGPDVLPQFSPTEEDADRAKNVWEAMGKGAKRYYETVKDAMALVSTCVYRVFQDIETNLGEVFFDAMMGRMKTFRDYVTAFARDIARTLSQMMARMAISTAISGLFPAPSASVIYPAHATGGITNGPSIAGESGPEAVVPLPGNRHIPVDLRGDRGREQKVSVTFNISAVDGPSVQRMLASQGRTISAIIQDALGRDTQLRAAVQAV